MYNMLIPVQGNCTDADMTQVLSAGVTASELLPLKPSQCLLLLPDTFAAMEIGRIWIDNLYLKLHRDSRVLPSLQRTPSLVAVGTHLQRFNDPELLTGQRHTEVHITDVTFHGDRLTSSHAVLAAGKRELSSTGVFIQGEL